MKAEHRKELQTNALADRLGRLVQGFRGGFKSRPSNTSLLIWGGILAVVALVVGWRWYRNTSERNLSAQWLQVDEASNLGDLERIASQNPNSQAARVVRFQMARVRLGRGMENYCSTDPDGRKNAMEDLQQAAQLYAELADQVKDHAVLAQEALLGAGKARESLNELDAAQGYYEQVAGRYPDSAAGKEAGERLKKLENKVQVSAFYKKLDELAGPITPPKKD